MPEYDIRPYRAGDELALLETFNAVFGENDPAHEARTLEQWRWAFEQNPAGRRIWVAECGGQIAAQCAALPYRVWIDGRASSFTQGVDSMVHPDHRRGLRRPGLFVATAQPFFREFSGPGKDLLHYGWPVEPAWRIGRTFLGYEIIRTQTVHFRSTSPGSDELPAGVERIESFGDEVERLYERCRSKWGASVIRDPAYLNWRYFDNPHFEYQVLGVRDGSELAGYAIFRKTDSPRPDSGLLMDWLVPDEDIEVGELLKEAILAQARREGASSILMVFPHWSPWHLRFQEWDWCLSPTDYLLIGIVQNPKYDTWWLRDNWWYQLSELDAI